MVYKWYTRQLGKGEVRAEEDNEGIAVNIDKDQSKPPFQEGLAEVTEARN